MSVKKVKSPVEPVKYKHRETLFFKGLTYRYDKTYGEWHLVDDCLYSSLRPPTIYEGAHLYTCDHASAGTPRGALEVWLNSRIGNAKRDLAAAEARIKDLTETIRELESTDIRAYLTKEKKGE